MARKKAMKEGGMKERKKDKHRARNHEDDSLLGCTAV
jgi:hypothetical protein